MARAWTTAPASGTAAVLGHSTIGGWTARVLERGYDNPELSWEFFDGDGWRLLEQGFVDETQELATSGTVSFRVPATLSATDIGGREDLSIRAGGRRLRAPEVRRHDDQPELLDERAVDHDRHQRPAPA